ncbi:hypothetical protein [Bacillus sp. B-jedd]|uniref:hypothetical protein n=1 Tax=Bacillus sp. B-jedd TaxID=1476857 RepID=UPI00051560C6|nr:hypothetical protein [Bacillus sp. B-jedd]CEG28666.1 high-affinity nickel-transporter [Bacillus sp. B-jedd]
MESTLAIMGIGFLLGIKHALEPDHVIAVSTITNKHRSLRQSGFLGVFWGVGHTLTLMAVFLLLFFTKGSISAKWELSFELIVGIMLIILGFTAYRKRKNTDISLMSNSNKQFFLKSMAIGQVHGLAGSAAMTLLALSMASSLNGALIYIGIFGVGTVLGMLLFTLFLSIPFILAKGASKVNYALTIATSILSVGYGAFYIYRIIFQEGLFS